MSVGDKTDWHILFLWLSTQIGCLLMPTSEVPWSGFTKSNYLFLLVRVMLVWVSDAKSSTLSYFQNLYIFFAKRIRCRMGKVFLALTFFTSTNLLLFHINSCVFVHDISYIGSSRTRNWIHSDSHLGNASTCNLFNQWGTGIMPAITFHSVV